MLDLVHFISSFSNQHITRHSLNAYTPISYKTGRLHKIFISRKIRNFKKEKSTLNTD